MRVISVYNAYQVDVTFATKAFSDHSEAREFFNESRGMGVTVVMENANGEIVDVDTQIDPTVIDEIMYTEEEEYWDNIIAEVVAGA